MKFVAAVLNIHRYMLFEQNVCRTLLSDHYGGLTYRQNFASTNLLKAIVEFIDAAFEILLTQR